VEFIYTTYTIISGEYSMKEKKLFNINNKGEIMKRYAVDFDGTLNLNESEYPYCYSPNTALFKFLIDKQKQGDKIILNTLREGAVLEMAVAFCEYNGLIFDAINDNITEDIVKWGYNPRKISADYYIDDRNILIDCVNKNEDIV